MVQTRAALVAENLFLGKQRAMFHERRYDREEISVRAIGSALLRTLNYLIPINECHLRLIVNEFTTHYSRGRPHSALGTGILDPPHAEVPAGPHEQNLPPAYRVASTIVLAGLYHEYRLEKEAA